MKHFFHIFWLVLVSTQAVLAQRSVVFLAQDGEEEGRTHRPRPGVYRKDVRIPQKPQVLGTRRTDFPNINISQYLLADQNETAVAINPNDPKNLIAGCNDYRSFNTLWHFSSLDGGLTWNAGPLPDNQALYTATDPSVGIGPDGVAFYGNGRVGSDGFPYPVNDVVSYKSTTKGASWEPAVRVVLDSIAPSSATSLADKYYIAVAPTSFGPLPPRVYMAWAEYIDGKSRIVASASGDAGASWSIPVAITALGKFQAPVPAVSAGGEVYVTFIDLDASKREILFAKSTNNGGTFSTPKKIANYNDLGPRYPEGDSFPHPVIKGHLRVNSFPSIAIDHLKHFNRIYTTWAGKGQDGRPHIYLSKSDDFGSTWSEALPIENDKSLINTDKFFPWIAVDPSTGTVGICFYDSRMDAANNELIDLFLGLSEDGGESFSVRRISDVSFDPGVSRSLDSIQINGDTMKFFGDYNGLTANYGMWYPVWTDSRVGYDQDIYIGIVDSKRPEAVRDLEVIEESGTHFPLLTWEHAGAVTVFGVPLEFAYTFEIKRSDGKSITLPPTARSFRDSSVAPSTPYNYEVTVVTWDHRSVPQEVQFIPRAVVKPQAPVVVTSVAESAGFLVKFRVPDKNIVGDTIRNLEYLYYIIDDVAVDSFKLNDGMRGMTLERSFTAAVGYHKFQLAATTSTSGELTTSDTSVALWLYAGTPREVYSESFEGTKDIFTIAGWDTTSVSLPSVFLNDDRPLIPYGTVNTWFLLPPLRVSDAVHTLEFDHLALVAQDDSALVEISLDNGVSYFNVRRYTIANEPVKWQHALSASVPANDSIALKWYMGKDAIARFRLSGTNATAEDGWFVDNIRFTDKLFVQSQWKNGLGELRIYPSVLSRRGRASADLTLHEGGALTVRIIDMLGRTITTISDGDPVFAGSHTVEFPAPGSGAYILEAIVITPGKPVTVLRGRFIVQE